MNFPEGYLVSFMYQSGLSSSFSHAELVSPKLYEVKKREGIVLCIAEYLENKDIRSRKLSDLWYAVKIFPFQTSLMYFNA